MISVHFEKSQIFFERLLTFVEILVIISLSGGELWDLDIAMSQIKAKKI